MIKASAFCFVLLTLILHSCTERCKAVSIDHGKFDGYALAFYHMPVSGSGCEIKFIPICRNKIVIKDSLIDVGFNDMSSTAGVSVVVSLDDLTFRNLFQNSQKLKLLNHDSLAPEFRYIYVCPVELKFTGVENNTPMPNRTGKDFFEEKLVLGNGQVFRLKYFFSNRIEIQKLETRNGGN